MRKAHSVVGIDAHVTRTAEEDPRRSRILNHAVTELGPADLRSNERFTKPTTLHRHLPDAMHLYDTMANKDLGEKKNLTSQSDRSIRPFWLPAIIRCRRCMSPLRKQVQRGTIVDYRDPCRSVAEADMSIFHVDVVDPKGNRNVFYSGTVLARQGAGVRAISFAVNARPVSGPSNVHGTVTSWANHPKNDVHVQ